MTTDNDIKQFTSHPMAYIIGGIGSVLGVLFAFGIDPISITGALFATLLAQSSNIFTALSIIGFTVAPSVDFLPAKPIQWAAIIFGIIVVLTILDTVWESLLSRRG